MFMGKAEVTAGVLTLAMVAICAASASATTTLRTDPGGALLSGSTVIVNTSSSPSTLSFPGTGTITCTQESITGDGSVDSSTGSITEQITLFTGYNCHDTIPVINITHCTLTNLPVAHYFADSPVGGFLDVDDVERRCSIAGSTTSFCYYTAASAVGTVLNATSTITFASTSVVTTSGSGSLGAACGSGTGTYSTTLRHIVQFGTNRTITLRTS